MGDHDLVANFQPEPGQIVTVFRSRLRGEGVEEYDRLSPEIDALAAGAAGLIDVKSFTATDGERVTIVTFADAEYQQAWRNHPQHLIAQARGKKEFYSEYTIQVCRTERTARLDSRGSDPE